LLVAATVVAASLTGCELLEFGIQHTEFYRVAADGTQRPLDIVCCGHYGDSSEVFYVGHGPAGYDVPDRPSRVTE
jgi:hypothetical protein